MTITSWADVGHRHIPAGIVRIVEGGPSVLDGGAGTSKIVQQSDQKRAVGRDAISSGATLIFERGGAVRRPPGMWVPHSKSPLRTSQCAASIPLCAQCAARVCRMRRVRLFERARARMRAISTRLSCPKCLLWRSVKAAPLIAERGEHLVLGPVHPTTTTTNSLRTACGQPASNDESRSAPSRTE